MNGQNYSKNNGSLHDKNIEKPWWQPAIFMFFKLSGWIAIPIIIGAFLGKWLDKKYDSEPLLFLVSTGAAFIVSMFGLIKNTMEEFKKIEKENQKKQEVKDKKK